MYVRSSTYVEVPATRSNSYQAFAKKATKLLKMEAKKGEELKLFKLNGAVIVDEKIDVGGGRGGGGVQKLDNGKLFKHSRKEISVPDQNRCWHCRGNREQLYFNVESGNSYTLILICRSYILIFSLSR